MKNKNLNTDDLFEKSAAFLSKGKINYEKSEEQIWEELNKKVSTKNKGKSGWIVFRYEKYSIAALFIILLGFAALTTFYSTTIESLPGEQKMVNFMCGSSAELNAGSTLKYYPLRWKMHRQVFLEGEAYFQVEKGKKFQVFSTKGTTEVLGTSFNVYARKEKYSVTCFTGKVKVSSSKKKSVTLTPNKKADLKNGVFVLTDQMVKEEVLSWKNKQFFFSNTPLNEVFNEIERQYGITVKVQPELAKRGFSSNFPKSVVLEEVFENICTPMQITWVKESENVFLVKENK